MVPIESTQRWTGPSRDEGVGLLAFSDSSATCAAALAADRGRVRIRGQVQLAGFQARAARARPVDVIDPPHAANSLGGCATAFCKASQRGVVMDVMGKVLRETFQRQEPTV
jgi:hypothetical protein